MSECQKIKKGGIDKYGPERFRRLSLKKRGTERVKKATISFRRVDINDNQPLFGKDELKSASHLVRFCSFLYYRRSIQVVSLNSCLLDEIVIEIVDILNHC